MKVMSRPKKNLMMAATIVIILNFTQCKYEDGPSFSLRTKTARLVGKWRVMSIDHENFSNEIQIEMEFDRSGDFDFTYGYSYYGYSYQYSYDGDWEWKSNKEIIDVNLDSDNIEFEVKRLTDKDLWFTDSEGLDWELEKL